MFEPSTWSAYEKPNGLGAKVALIENRRNSNLEF